MPTPRTKRPTGERASRVVFIRDAIPPCPMPHHKHFLNPTCSERIRFARQQAHAAALTIVAVQLQDELDRLAAERDKLRESLDKAGKRFAEVQRSVNRVDLDWTALLPKVTAA